MYMYNTTCMQADVNRLLDDSEPLLPVLEDVTVVKYRKLKNVPFKISCLSVFILEAGGICASDFSNSGAQALLLSRYLCKQASKYEICTRVRFQVDVSPYLADASVYYQGSTNYS